MELKQDNSWIGPLSSEEAARQIRLDLFVTDEQIISKEALRTEILRTVIWNSSASESSSSPFASAASTRRVLTQARAMWMPFTSEFQEGDAEYEELSPTDLERDLLDALEEQGDVLSLAGGKWLPAPLRLVPLTNTHYFLVGGMPTHLLPQAVLATLHFHGGFRHLNEDTFSDTIAVPSYIGSWATQLLDHWLGPSPLTLEQLLQRFHTQTLQALSNPSRDAQNIEIYVPYINKPQVLRWRSPDHVPSGRYLMRTQNAWGMNRYSIGEIHDHLLLHQADVPPSTDIRRLCYALDYEAQSPTQVVWDHKDGSLILKSELPMRERKLLTSIATLRTPDDGYYPRTWVGIAPRHRSKVDELLTHLHVNAKIESGS